mgnify:CR=1 FL=1
MKKVQYKYRVGSKYHQVTESMPIPTTSLGFVLFNTLADAIRQRLKEKGVSDAKLIWYRIAE